ncbi:MAG: hypothetical protein A2122_00610 [Candidatus Liptonbacteria bacterium GWB1_49_6]|uniref:Spore protein YkvP/CgeB glycosyl transferase-like domain-containing protein n=1 Tax=Candidatus Liptonbacteria bacterium GWB1_49_6 TaxID=1798644 RepID=A0A1G2C7I8_9BACT|nr:MAG: hypothetical protein A2122_00610 [Candidatus Liptonbacteria bacterium GWB1_49_6]
MKILYAGLRYELYDPGRGWSFEYLNFFSTLRSLPGVEVIEHPFDRILEVGRQKFNEELFALIRRENPDLFFAFMYTDELDREILLKIKNETKTKTLAWFSDDYWRFWNYSRHWAPYFSWIVTTDAKAVERYRDAGSKNVVHSQWACNKDIFKPLDLQKDINVSFVGQYKGPRAAVLRQLAREGINVEAFGFGWPARTTGVVQPARMNRSDGSGGPNGKISEEKMVEIISRSKINLNLNVRPGFFAPRALARLFLKKSMNRLVPDIHLIDNIRAYLHFPTLHIHARPFELAGCRAFVISGHSGGIEDYYEKDKETVFYSSLEDLAKKIKFYLAHPEERERIAEAAYRRTLAEHTYECRFRRLFREINLPL